MFRPLAVRFRRRASFLVIVAAIGFALAPMAGCSKSAPTAACVDCGSGNVYWDTGGLLANMAVTVDHISNGRLEVGIGAAWHEPEHKGLGIGFPRAGERVAMLDEAALDRAVQVLVAVDEPERARSELGLDLLEAVTDAGVVLVGEQAEAAQLVGVGARAGEVVGPQPHVEVHAPPQPPGRRVRLLPEPRAPQAAFSHPGLPGGAPTPWSADPTA